jgi:hypothetical protein
MTRIDYFSSALLSLPLLASVACTAEIPTNNGTGGTGGSAPTAGTGGSAGTMIGTESCDDDGMGVAIPKRLVRLSYSQVANGVSSVLGAPARTAVDATGVAPKAKDRKFQPLFTEGTQISTAVLPKTIQMAKAAADTVTAAPGCAAGDDACAQQFLLTLAQKAYRRALTADEQKSIQDFYAALKGHGDTVEQAVTYGVKGILLAAPALYRTEFGPAAGGRLEPAEIASQVSYFLHDGPPDADLLAAAASGGLATEAGVRQQIDRLLALPAVRDNLKQVMLAYFQVGNIYADVKDPALYPEYTSGLKNSMYTENERFVADVLWNGGKVSDLLTSRKAFVNKVIAPIYGVTYPGPATDLEDVFLPIDLPAEQRAGLLTRGAMLAMRSRPEETSVVSRGLFVNATMLCAQQPPEPPANVLDQVDQQLSDKTATQRQKADYRAKTSPCSGCHQFFDAYGLVLENYDAIGRYRTTYATFPGMPAIDPSGTLPEVAGGKQIQNVFELVQAVTENGRFSHCVAANLMRYALADASLLPSEDCAVTKANTAFRATDQSFSSLIKEIAVAQTVSTRVAQ